MSLKLIKISNPDGSPLYIEVSTILAISSFRDGSRVWSSIDNKAFQTKEKPDEIYELIRSCCGIEPYTEQQLADKYLAEVRDSLKPSIAPVTRPATSETIYRW